MPEPIKGMHELINDNAVIIIAAVSDVITKVNTVIATPVSKCPTSLILVNTKGSEYVDLDDNKKAAYSLYISAGTLDMTVDSKAWNLFLGWIFPLGTVSHTDILAALAAL
jgi:hypothetical protein